MAKKNCIKIAGKVIFFLAIFAIIFKLIFSVIWYNDTEQSSNVFKQFYELPNNSVDVIYIGPSSVKYYWVASAAFHNYGISVYPLATGGQPFSACKYLIEEAEKTQNPVLYIIDIRMLASNDAPLDAEIRRVCDGMKNSANRIAAINHMTEFGARDIDESEFNRWDYYFSFQKYHSRWKSLNSQDFGDRTNFSMGFVPLDYVTPFSPPSEELINTPNVALSDISKKWLEDFLEYCDQNDDLNVLFINSPHMMPEIVWGTLNEAKSIIEKRGYKVLDVNEHVDETGLDYQFDMREENHVNPYGALKYTDYLSKYLLDNYPLADHRGDENYDIWEQSYSDFENYLVNNTVNLYNYFNGINKKRYTILLSVKDEASVNFTETIYKQMTKLGLQCDLRGKVQQAYIAVIDQGEVVYEALAPDKTTQLSYNYTLQNGLECKITSGGLYSGNVSSILIGENEYSMNQRGLNFVIYDNVTQSIVDQVCFDTWDHPNCEGNYPYFRAN